MIAVALFNLISSSEPRDKRIMMRNLGIVLLILAIVGMPFYIQIGLVSKRANDLRNMDDSKQTVMLKSFYNYLSSSSFDIKKYVPTGCRIAPYSLRHPPHPGSSAASIYFKGTPFENRDSNKAIYANYTIRCNSYEEAINFYEGFLQKAEVPNIYYEVLSTTDQIDDVLFVEGSPSTRSIFISRAIIPSK